MLLQIAEKVLPVRLKAGLLSYCPTMDLVALATEDEHVQVFRFNGQKVFVAPNQVEGVAVTSLRWKPNGHVLLIAYDNATLSLVSAYTGKLMNSINLDVAANTLVCCLGWGVTFTNPVVAKSLLEIKKVPTGAGVAARKAMQRGGLLEEALSKGLSALEIEMPLDLPAELRNLDVEFSLPKLSTLPVSATGDDVFSTRASIDTIFHTTKKTWNELADLIIIGFDNGSLHLSIYDFFELGSLNTLANEYKGYAVHHCSHPYSTTNGLLLKGSGSSKSFSFLPMDLKLLHDHGDHLPLLASKSGQIQNLLRYMKATIAQISADFQATQELPQKFIRNAEEDLQEKEQTSFSSAIYHFAVTGDCSPVLKDWLVDQIGDRGHKRWEKTTTTGYEGVCRHALQNLIPALDRFMILITRLRGLARFIESSSALGLSVPALDKAMDTADSMKLLAHVIVQTASEELDGFEAFSNWMKLEIEVQSTDPTSAAADDFPGKYAAIDYNTLFAYVEGPIQQSQLTDLCSDGVTAGKSERLPLHEESSGIYEEIKKRLVRGLRTKPRPTLMAILSRLDKQCQAMFSAIAVALSRKIQFGTLAPLYENAEVERYDSIMTVEERSGENRACCATVAFSIPDRSTIGLKRVHLKLTNGISEVSSIDAANLKLPPDRRLQDLRFADNRTLVLATTSMQGELPWIAFVPFHEAAEDEHGLSYSPISITGGSLNLGNELDLSDPLQIGKYIKHTFQEKPLLNPIQLEVNGRKGRRALCVVASDRLRYRVFDLDESSDTDHSTDDADEMEIEQ